MESIKDICAASVPVTDFGEALRLAGTGQSGKMLLRFD